MMDVAMLHDSNQANRLLIEACQQNGFRESQDYNAEKNLVDSVVQPRTDISSEQWNEAMLI